MVLARLYRRSCPARRVLVPATAALLLAGCSLSMPMGTPQAIMLEQYRRVAAEVMPHFRH